MLRGPASVRCGVLWWDVWADFWVGWQRWRRADYEDVDKFQRWRRWRRRTSADEARWGDACWLSLSHTHTHRYIQTHSATDVRQAAAPILNTHTDRRQPFWLPHRLFTCASLCYPLPLPSLLSSALLKMASLKMLFAFLFGFALLPFPPLLLLSSSACFWLARFSFILYFYTIKYTWRGVSM